MRICRPAGFAAVLLLGLALPPDIGVAREAPPSRSASDATRDAADLAAFEHRAALSKELGATQMVVTEDLPLATWEMDRNDPYPAWFVHHATLFKIFPPADVQPFVDLPYATRVQGIVAKRCAVLKSNGLNAIWNANEPAVLPEAFFVAHPELRGPRIDHPSRSRKEHFAPNVDQPETLRMYRESVQIALRVCPQIETFTWVTTDAGSGFDWTPSLYAGSNGNSNFRDRPIADRVAGFMINVQEAAKQAGHEVRININPIEPRQWMIPTFAPDVLENIVRKLPRGLAVQNLEGPDGRPFATGGRGGGWGGPFYPVVGLVVPQLAAMGTVPGAPQRLAVNLGDPQSVEFTYRLLKSTRGATMNTLATRITALRAFAVAEVGESQADNLIEIWSALGDVRQKLEVLDFGGMLRFGHVLNRWITRPMVPFPLELSDAEKGDYRAFLFQAKGDEQAANLIDIQAMRMFEGWGARLLFQRTIETAMPRATRALALLDGIAAAAPEAATRAQWILMGKRVQAVIYLLQSADNMVGYQAQLDRVKSLAAKPETNPVLGVQGSWDRADLMATARKEIDTMLNLQRLLRSTNEPLLDLAPTAGDETIMRLGPEVANQLTHKIDAMNRHWRDYDRLFTIPNP
jgi:hypothetical protein